MGKRGKQYIHYIRVTFSDGSIKQYKQTANCRKNAVFNLMKALDRADVRHISIPEGVPKSGKARQEKLEHKRAMREHHKRKREESYMMTRVDEDGHIII